MKNVSTSILSAALLCALSAPAANWEPCLSGTQALKVHCTTEGTVLSSDYDYIGKTGGIYYSEDHGGNWTKSNAPDYFYWDFCETPEYIFATGFECRVARSEDGGRNWLILNYESLAEQYMSPKEFANLESVQSFSIAYDQSHKRLFNAVFSQDLGVVYSDDDGETWKRTNPEGMLLESDPNKGVNVYDNIYKVIVFKDKVYALGMIYHYEYDYTTDGWTRILNDKGELVNSNFMCTATVMDNTIYAARSIEDNTITNPLMSVSGDMHNWTALPRPENAESNYINGICNDGHYVYALSFYYGVFYTADKGTTWQCTGTAGYPDFKPEQFIGEAKPTGISVDDKYLYICLFEMSNPNSGIYRMPIPERAGTTAVETAGPQVRVDGHRLEVTGTDAADITVTDLAGVRVLNVHGTGADLSGLPAGMYIHTVTTTGTSVSGKFMIR